MMQIKDNCWKIEGTKQHYFLKKYKNQKIYDKVKTILQAKIPFVSPALSYREPFIVFPWLEGRAANYSKHEDCQRVYYMLQQFHDAGKACVEVAPPLQLEAKWHFRYQQFQMLKEVKEVLGTAFDDLIRVAEFSLLRATFPRGDVTLLHGDVAHHNFLLEPKDSYIIDLDLASAGTEAEEFTLWMHRLLPHFSYDLYQLLEVLPQLEQFRDSFPLLLFPNELLREWLFFYEDEAFQPYLKAMTIFALERWPTLHQQIMTLK